MIIKKIKKLKNGRYQIEFESGEKIVTYDEVILKYNLLYKKELDIHELNEINKGNDYYSVYNDLIKYLTKKVHSKKEYFKYIEKYNLSLKDKERLTKELENIKLLDDNRFLKAFVSDKFYLTNDGPLKIKKELLQHNIEEDLISDELSKIPEEDLLNKVNKLISKRIKNIKSSSYMIRQKIYYDMNMLGYSNNLIDICLNDEIDDLNNLERDFNKYYNAYYKKETDTNKLYYKIKQKLYQKGYSLEEIGNYIDKQKNS